MAHRTPEMEALMHHERRATTDGAHPRRRSTVVIHDAPASQPRSHSLRGEALDAASLPAQDTSLPSPVPEAEASFDVLSPATQQQETSPRRDSTVSLRGQLDGWRFPLSDAGSEHGRSRSASAPASAPIGAADSGPPGAADLVGFRAFASSEAAAETDPSSEQEEPQPAMPTPSALQAAGAALLREIHPSPGLGGVSPSSAIAPSPYAQRFGYEDEDEEEEDDDGSFEELMPQGAVLHRDPARPPSHVVMPGLADIPSLDNSRDASPAPSLPSSARPASGILDTTTDRSHSSALPMDDVPLPPSPSALLSQPPARAYGDGGPPSPDPEPALAPSVPTLAVPPTGASGSVTPSMAPSMAESPRGRPFVPVHVSYGSDFLFVPAVDAADPAAPAPEPAPAVPEPEAEASDWAATPVPLHAHLGHHGSGPDAMPQPMHQLDAARLATQPRQWRAAARRGATPVESLLPGRAAVAVVASLVDGAPRDRSAETATLEWPSSTGGVTAQALREATAAVDDDIFDAHEQRALYGDEASDDARDDPDVRSAVLPDDTDGPEPPGRDRVRGPFQRRALLVGARALHGEEPPVAEPAAAAAQDTTVGDGGPELVRADEAPAPVSARLSTTSLDAPPALSGAVPAALEAVVAASSSIADLLLRPTGCDPDPTGDPAPSAAALMEAVCEGPVGTPERGSDGERTPGDVLCTIEVERGAGEEIVEEDGYVPPEIAAALEARGIAVNAVSQIPGGAAAPAVVRYGEEDDSDDGPVDAVLPSVAPSGPSPTFEAVPEEAARRPARPLPASEGDTSLADGLREAHAHGPALHTQEWRADPAAPPLMPRTPTAPDSMALALALDTEAAARMAPAQHGALVQGMPGTVARDDRIGRGGVLSAVDALAVGASQMPPPVLEAAADDALWHVPADIARAPPVAPVVQPAVATAPAPPDMAAATADFRESLRGMVRSCKAHAAAVAPSGEPSPPRAGLSDARRLLAAVHAGAAAHSRQYGRGREREQELLDGAP